MQAQKFEEITGVDPFRHFLTGNGFNEVDGMATDGFQTNYIQSSCSDYSSSFYNPVEVSSEITDIAPEVRALSALKNHKEAEKRRRERIKAHLDNLRTLLPCTSKTDKASLLGKVVERVRELKQQTSETLQLETFPSETDEIQVVSSSDHDHNSSCDDGKILIKASVCCEDRSDLMPDLIEMLKSLDLSPLRAEMVTLGGRIRNVIVLAVDKDRSSSTDESLVFLIGSALKSLVQRSAYGSRERSKRRRSLLFDQKE